MQLPPLIIIFLTSALYRRNPQIMPSYSTDLHSILFHCFFHFINCKIWPSRALLTIDIWLYYQQNRTIGRPEAENVSKRLQGDSWFCSFPYLIAQHKSELINGSAFRLEKYDDVSFSQSGSDKWAFQSFSNSLSLICDFSVKAGLDYTTPNVYEVGSVSHSICPSHLWSINSSRFTTVHFRSYLPVSMDKLSNGLPAASVLKAKTLHTNSPVYC